ncbi:hypothetical protein RAS1_24690 [Phycisphaerae bacterium RAS1]|nr:hypothetical protein RAS1_24690 [Phycisphaerae bacterium RAS1]
MNHAKALTLALLAAVAICSIAVTVRADELEGRYRIVLLDGRVHEGTVTDTGDAYQIKNKGITVTIKKNQVSKLELLPADGQAAAAKRETAKESSTGRSPLDVSDDEIESIIGGLEIDEDELSAAVIDPAEALPTDEPRLAEMMRLAGPKAKTLLTDHFVFAYSSDKETAVRMAAKLEGVYRWVLRFEEILEIPKQRPDSRLEIFFFGTYDEFQAYADNDGGMPMGVLGFYYRDKHRSAFFDMHTWPPIARLLEQTKNPSIPYTERSRVANLVRRWSHHHNLEVVQHEAAHHIHFSAGVYNRRGLPPRWAVEGLATMFETPPNKSGGSLGAINHPRLFEFRRIYGPKGENIPDMKRFLIDDRMWQGGPSYCLGWAINQYLWKKHRAGYAKWMQSLAADEDVMSFEGGGKLQGAETDLTPKLKRFEDIFGVVDEKWEKDFKDYIASIQLLRSELPPELF